MKFLRFGRKTYIIFFLLFGALYPGSVFAQLPDGQGKLVGRVLNEQTNEGLFGAAVFISGTNTGTTTDFEGRFQLVVPSGTIQLEVKMLGYQSRALKDLQVRPKEVTPLTVYLKESTVETKVVEVVAKAEKNNENALLKDQRASQGINSGITAEMLGKTPDRNLTESLKRISGTSVREGKFAMVRGLSERYNMGLLNGVSIPSTESDRKAFSLELFPSNLLDKIVVSKTATPDMPGDVAGGLIKIQTLDIPYSNSFQATLASEYNSLTTAKEFREIKRSSTDVFGFDNGLRSVPNGVWTTDQGSGNQDLQLRSRQSLVFDHTVVPQKYKAAPNWSGQISLGRRGKLWGKTVGLVASVNYYRNNARNVFTSDYPTLNPGSSVVTENSSTYQDRFRTFTSLSGVLNFSLKPGPGSKIALRNFISQTGNNQSQFSLSQYENYQSPLIKDYADRTSTISFYEQNTLISNQLMYERFLDTEGSKLELIVGTHFLERSTPDYSRLNYDRAGTTDSLGNKRERFQLVSGNLPPVSFSQDFSGKFFSSLTESALAPSVQLSKFFKIAGIENVAKMGGSFQTRGRDFSGRNYLYIKGASPGAILFQGPDSIFRSENFSPNRLMLTETTQKSDFYKASSDLYAGFLMNETRFGKKGSRLIYGIRYEEYRQVIEAAEIGKKVPTRAETVVGDFLPSVNLVYNPTEKFGVRAAWSQTLNRPEFRELAGFTFFEPSQNVYFYGNPNLQRSKITNYDLKLEWYPSEGSILSLNGFYKKFDNPIEVTRGFVTTLPTFTYSNRDEATSYGWELEARDRLTGLDSLLGTRFFSGLTAFGNFSWIRSEVVYAQTNFKRPIHGQSPYVLNAGLQYSIDAWDVDFFLSYNRIGPRVAFLDDQNYAALIWEKPRDIVDFSIAKTLGRWNIRIVGSDIFSQDLIQYIVLDRGGRKADNTGLFGWVSNVPSYQEGQDVPYFRFTNPSLWRISIRYSM